MKDEKLYTLKETAKLIGCCERSMFKYLHEGKIKGIRIGRLWKVKESEIAYIKENGLRN